MIMNYSGLKEDKRLIEAVPTARQIAYESMEFFCFIHFTVNTLPEENGAMEQSRNLFLIRQSWMQNSGRKQPQRAV